MRSAAQLLTYEDVPKHFAKTPYHSPFPTR
jgi:hypothetical protein